MRGPPSPASLWWCTTGSVAAGTPVAFRAESISSRNDDGAGDARRECASVTARSRACVPRVVKRVLATRYTYVDEAHSHTHAKRSDTHPPASPCRGGECAYVRVKSGPPIDSEQLRAGPDRPVSPFPPGAPRRPASRRCSPFLRSLPRVCVLCVCIRRMNALLLRGGRSCHDSVPSFFEIYRYRYSIRPPIWISVCLFAGLAVPYRCVLLG